MIAPIKINMEDFIEAMDEAIERISKKMLEEKPARDAEWDRIINGTEWLKDPDVVEGAKRDGNDDFWVTMKGYRLEKLQMHAGFNYEEDLLRPFLASRIEEGAIKDGEVVDWEAELELFKKTVSEEDIERAQEYCSTIYVDVRKDIIDELEPDDLDRFITDWFNIRTK